LRLVKTVQRYGSLVSGLWDGAEVEWSKNKEIRSAEWRGEEGGAMNFPPERVLLATDGSHGSELAAQAAIELCNGFDSELHVLRVGNVPDLYLAPDSLITDPELWRNLREAAERELLEETERHVARMKTLGARITGTHRRTGRPDREIVALAEELGADLIVVGSRGLGGIRRAVMGSVSGSVVVHAHCPVLVVRDDREERGSA
jgi:nucleotide-binding universal stress UspA family protein